MLMKITITEKENNNTSYDSVADADEMKSLREQNNELLEKIKYYEYETDFLRRMAGKALKAEAEARAEVRGLYAELCKYKDNKTEGEIKDERAVI